MDQMRLSVNSLTSLFDLVGKVQTEWRGVHFEDIGIRCIPAPARYLYLVSPNEDTGRPKAPYRPTRPLRGFWVGTGIAFTGANPPESLEHLLEEARFSFPGRSFDRIGVGVLGPYISLIPLEDWIP
ncbi:MAG: hypothetical protein RLZZ347_31 [Candidatus Parcubacteria bacterium]|jgi:hypothetical protein